jgi:hypothetical protein
MVAIKAQAITAKSLLSFSVIIKARAIISV